MLRARKNCHIEVIRHDGRWCALLQFPDEIVLLDSREDFTDLVEDCLLNSTFDRAMWALNANFKMERNLGED